MRRYLILVIFFVSVFSQDPQLKLPVRADTHQKLSLSLSRLVDQLQFFRTPYENKTSLYKRVALTEQYLQEVHDQVCQYNNVIVGQQNQVDGQKNVIVGSYNTIKGSNNFVFIQKYSGQANGDLLIGKWRIEIEKKKLILINSSLAISSINQEENRKYLRFLTQNRGFGYGSSLSENTYTVIKQSDDSASSGSSYGSTGDSFQYSQNKNINYGSSSSVANQQNLQSSTGQVYQNSLGNQNTGSSTQPQGTYSNEAFNNRYSYGSGQSNSLQTAQASTSYTNDASNSVINSRMASQDSIEASSSSQYVPYVPISNGYTGSSYANPQTTSNPGLFSSSSGQSQFSSGSLVVGSMYSTYSGSVLPTPTPTSNTVSNLRSQNPPSNQNSSPKNSLGSRYVRGEGSSSSYPQNSQYINSFFNSYSSTPPNSYSGSVFNQGYQNLFNFANFRNRY